MILIDSWNTLESVLGLQLPGTLVFDYPTVHSISEYLVTLFGGESVEPIADGKVVLESDTGFCLIGNHNFCEPKLALQGSTLGKDGITILVSDYVKNHIMTHNKPGIGSVFKKGVSEDDILRMVKAISTKVSGKGGPYQINSPGAGYDLVLPIEDAKKLRDAKEGTVEKQEGPNKVKVPSISPSQPIKDFTTDKVSLLVFPSNPQFLPDDVKNDKSVHFAFGILLLVFSTLSECHN